MLKKTITYTDFNGDDRTEDFYFNLTQTEITEMELSVDGGFAQRLKRIAASNCGREIFATFKTFILDSFGVKSDDGRHFRKSAEIAQDFVASPAFDVLMRSFDDDAIKAADFIKGLLPQNMVGQFEAAMKEAEAASTPAELSSVAGMQATSAE